MFAPRWPTPITHLARLSTRPATTSTASRLFPRTLCTSTPTLTPRSTSFLRSYRLALFATLPAVALGLGLSRDGVKCASDRTYAASPPPTTVGAGAEGAGALPEAESIVNVRDLGFGTVSGICVGIFVKKGLKAVAFALGGVFVLMQYLSSRSFISINWSGLTSSYDTFITKRAGPPTAQGGNRLVGLGNWFIDFVSADVQSRATFVAGIFLGFRLG